MSGEVRICFDTATGSLPECRRMPDVGSTLKQCRCYVVLQHEMTVCEHWQWSLCCMRVVLCEQYVPTLFTRLLDNTSKSETGHGRKMNEYCPTTAIINESKERVSASICTKKYFIVKSLNLADIRFTWMAYKI